MPSTDPAGRAAEADESDLSRSYTAVILVEVVVVAALLWLGSHFG